MEDKVSAEHQLTVNDSPYQVSDSWMGESLLYVGRKIRFPDQRMLVSKVSVAHVL